MVVETETDQDWAKDVKTETLSKVLLEKNQTSNTAIYNFALILCFLEYILRECPFQAEQFRPMCCSS